MPNLTFKQFLGEYGIRMLFVATEDIQPGIVIQPNKKGFFKYDDLYKVFNQPSDEWAHQFRQANMITGTVSRSLSLAGKASLDEFGVSIQGGLARSKRVTFKLKDIKARSLATRTRADIEHAIATLKKTDKARYRRYANKFALDQTFYADSFEAEFDVDGKVDLRSELEGKIQVHGEAEIMWTSRRTFQVASNAAVPFGFAGVKI